MTELPISHAQCSSLIKLKLTFFSIVSLVIAPYISIKWETKHVTVLQCASMCAYLYLCIFMNLCVCIWVSNPPLRTWSLMTRSKKVWMRAWRTCWSRRSKWTWQKMCSLTSVSLRWGRNPSWEWLELWGFYISSFFGILAIWMALRHNQGKNTSVYCAGPVKSNFSRKHCLILSVSGDCLLIIAFWAFWYLLSTLFSVSPLKSPYVALNLSG